MSEGKRLADKIGQKVTAALLGQNIKAKAASPGNHGADKIIVADDPKLANYLPDAYAAPERTVETPGKPHRSRTSIA